jgi:hypothetical protein
MGPLYSAGGKISERLSPLRHFDELKVEEADVILQRIRRELSVHIVSPRVSLFYLRFLALPVILGSLSIMGHWLSAPDQFVLMALALLYVALESFAFALRTKASFCARELDRALKIDQE